MDIIKVLFTKQVSEKSNVIQLWWQTPVIPEFGMWQQEDNPELLIQLSWPGLYKSLFFFFF